MFNLAGADGWLIFVQLLFFLMKICKNPPGCFSAKQGELPNSYKPCLWVYKDFYDIMNVEDSPTAVLQCSVNQYLRKAKRENSTEGSSSLTRVIS